MTGPDGGVQLLRGALAALCAMGTANPQQRLQAIQALKRKYQVLEQCDVKGRVGSVSIFMLLFALLWLSECMGGINQGVTCKQISLGVGRVSILS